MMRPTKHITYKGETLAISEWADRTGLPRNTIESRYFRDNWSAEKTLTEPVRGEFSKNAPSRNDAQWKLDETPKDQLPKEILAVVVETGYKGRRFGEHVRSKRKDVFDKWFSESFLCSN